MVRTTLGLCALVLSGCAAQTVADSKTGPGDGGPDPCSVKVFVRAHPNGGKPRILVDNDPVYPKDSCTSVTWQLMKHDYVFDRDKGIVVGGTPSPANCGPGAAADLYSCTFTPQPPGIRKFPYSITVVGPDGVPQTVDPSVMTD